MNPLDLILKFIPPTWLIAIAGFFAALALVFGYLYRSEVGDYAKFKADVSAQQDRIKIDNERKLNLSKQVTVDTANAWAMAVNHLRSHPPVRVLRSNCDSGTGLRLPTTTAKPDDPSAADSADSPISLTAEQCEKYLGDGIEDALKFTYLQAWVKDQHGIKP